MNCKFKYCNDVTGKKPAPFYVQINQNIFFTGLLGFENNFNGIYFHYHLYVKTGVKSPSEV